MVREDASRAVEILPDLIANADPAAVRFNLSLRHSMHRPPPKPRRNKLIKNAVLVLSRGVSQVILLHGVANYVEGTASAIDQESDGCLFLQYYAIASQFLHFGGRIAIQTQICALILLVLVSSSFFANLRSLPNVSNNRCSRSHGRSRWIRGNNSSKIAEMEGPRDHSQSQQRCEQESRRFGC